MKFFQTALVLFFLTVSFFLVFIVISDAFKDVNKTFVDLDEESEGVVLPAVQSDHSSISPDGKYVIYQKEGSEGKYRSLEFLDLETNEREVLSTVSTLNEFHSFIWTPDSERVYYAWTGSDNSGNTTFFYHVPSDIVVDGGAGIVYEDDDLILSGKVTISRVDGDRLYVQKDNKIYFLDAEHGVGAIPILYKDLGQSDLLISEKRVTSYVELIYETGSSGQQCWVFDLNDYIPTKDEVAKTYTWIIELPDDDCVIGKPATDLPETLGETINENIHGTNYRRIIVSYK